MATDRAIPVIAAGGVAAVTPAGLAKVAKCSRQAVAQWFGSTSDLRAAVVRCFLARWAAWHRSRADGYGITGYLPTDPDDLVFTVVWLAIAAFERHDETVADLLRVHRDAEREAILRMDAEGGPDLVLALVHGLRHAVCRADDPMPVAKAPSQPLAAIARANSTRVGTAKPVPPGVTWPKAAPEL